MTPRRATLACLVAGALAAGASAQPPAPAPPPWPLRALVVPPERSAIDVAADFVLDACGGSEAPAPFAVTAGSATPGAVESAVVTAARARLPAPGDDAGACAIVAERRGRDLVLRARPATSAVAIGAAVRWDAQLAALAGGVRPLDEGRVRAEATPLAGRGYVGAVATPRDDGAPGALLFAVRADAVDVFALELGDGGRMRARAVASSTRPAVERATGAPRRSHATVEPRGGGVEITWFDAPRPFRATLAGAALELAETTACAPLGHRIGGLCALRIEGRDYFADRAPREGGGRPMELGSAFYARATALVRGADGVAHEVAALATTGGRLVVGVRALGPTAARPRPTRSAGVLGHGLAVAIADVDLDGDAEVLASSDRPLGEGDRLTLYRVRASGTVLRLWDGAEVPGSITVATSADVDGDGRAELLAIEEPARGTEARLWRVR